MCGPLHMILPLENYNLFLLNICLVGTIFLFIFFPLKVSETTIPFGLLRLVEQLVPCSAPANALSRLRLFPNTVSTASFKIQITPMDITNSERLHTKDNGPLQIEVPTSAYKTHSYLQTKISHKANETRVAKPTVSRYLLYKRDNRTRLWRPSPSRDYKRSDLTTKLEGLGSFLDQQCRSPQPSLLPSEPLHQKNGQAKNFRSDLQGIMLALRRTMEPRTSLHEGATSCEEDIEPSEESLEPEEVTEEEPQSADFTVHALAGYSNP
ncbi:hypothetical protein BHM03_00053950 [Ensete ventricosum]|nr:hypothetical protein BHM03_00053950 [Ensete ventricosum]